jgi:hypothetical protein
MYDLIKEFLKPELFVLIPVLYFIGMGLKAWQKVPDKDIPLLLGVIGCLLSIVYIAANTTVVGNISDLMIFFTGITQGILLAGATVYIDQIIKQSIKNE